VPPGVLPALAGASNRNGSKIWTLRSSHVRFGSPAVKLSGPNSTAMGHCTA
jgi:hypothetical protein